MSFLRKLSTSPKNILLSVGNPCNFCKRSQIVFLQEIRCNKIQTAREKGVRETTGDMTDSYNKEIKKSVKGTHFRLGNFSVIKIQLGDTSTEKSQGEG